MMLLCDRGSHNITMGCWEFTLNLILPTQLWTSHSYILKTHKTRVEFWVMSRRVVHLKSRKLVERTWYLLWLCRIPRGEGVCEAKCDPGFKMSSSLMLWHSRSWVRVLWCMTWRLPPTNGQDNCCIHVLTIIQQKRCNIDGGDVCSNVAISSC